MNLYERLEQAKIERSEIDKKIRDLELKINKFKVPKPKYRPGDIFIFTYAPSEYAGSKYMLSYVHKGQWALVEISRDMGVTWAGAVSCKTERDDISVYTTRLPCGEKWEEYFIQCDKYRNIGHRK
jgi:hypothetical protein